MSTVTTLGLIADTHIPYRMARLPDCVLTALAGVDLILHAGDVDDPAALAPLQTIAPVHAVRGNIHLQDLSDGGASLPAEVRLDLAGYTIVVTHGHQPGILGLAMHACDVALQVSKIKSTHSIRQRIIRYLARRHPEADIVVFGHSHHATVQRIGDALLINPGAVCPSPYEVPTVARLSLGDGRPRVRFVLLK